MNLSDTFRRAKTSGLARLIAFSSTSKDELALWHAVSDISSRMTGLDKAARTEKVQQILGGLDELGWNMTPAEDGAACRKLLKATLEGFLDSGHEYPVLSDRFGKFLMHIRREEIDGLSSFDFMMENIGQMREVAQLVLDKPLPPISLKI